MQRRARPTRRTCRATTSLSPRSPARSAPRATSSRRTSTTRHLDADAALGVYLYEVLDDLRIGLVTARQDESGQASPAHVTDASLVTRDGSILDSANDAAADVVAIRIDLRAGGTGGIGVPQNDLEINSSTAGFATGRLF